MLIISRLRLDRPGSVTNYYQYRYIHQVITIIIIIFEILFFIAIVTGYT